ncbi:vegetative cell wall protein gp1-like [Punica granatum]|uniref:Vegetative cell wall protein gp1-like n=1 Tax=Punica granatum TaxID=22663 RepID=A0A218WEP4_PUNGR|nr:vegetative cell wall protein gp1-like [Punica granatum]OWM71307.1 hypothetical protein CDL15_Pgr011435 [Punica granatum]
MANNNPKEKGISINDNDGPGSQLHQSTSTAGQGLKQIRPSHDKGKPVVEVPIFIPTPQSKSTLQIRPSQVFPSPPATIPPLYRPPRSVYISSGSPHVSFPSPPAIKPPPRRPASPSFSPQLQLSQFNGALSPSVPSPQAPNAPARIKHTSSIRPNQESITRETLLAASRVTRSMMKKMGSSSQEQIGKFSKQISTDWRTSRKAHQKDKE